MKVSNYYIGYFDILGYKDLMQSLGENSFLQIINDLVLEVVKALNKKIKFIAEDLRFGYRIFSDNILIYCPLPNNKTEIEYLSKFNDNIYKSSFNFVNYEIIYLSLLMEQIICLQKSFIEKYGIFIRGGITRGTLFCDDNFIYGQGLIEAYNLENHIAKHPRIIISNKIVDLIEKYSEEELRFNRFPSIERINDDILFLNYLHMVDDSFMEMHKALISSRIATYRQAPSILEKYLWCKDYHNKVCYDNKLQSLIE